MQSLITNIMATTVQPARWGEALDEFNQYFELPSTAILSFNSHNNYKKDIYTSAFLRNALSPELLDYLSSGQDNDNDAYQALLRMKAQILYREDTIISAPDNPELLSKDLKNPTNEPLNLPESRLRDIMGNNGISIRIASKLNLSGPWMDGFFIHTKTTQQGRRIIANNEINLLLPIIAQSLNLGRCFEALRQQFNAALSALDHLGLGVFLLNNQGDIINFNNEAQRIIDLKDGLTMTANNKLRMKPADTQDTFNLLVQQANGVLQGDVVKFNNLLSIQRPSRKFDYLVTVRPMLDHLGELEKNLGCAFVSVIDPCRKNTISIEGLTTLGSLSIAESEVVRLIVNGYKTDEVADHRGVSLNTVKSQLKAISSKLHCSGQSDIIRTAVATKIPIIEL